MKPLTEIQPGWPTVCKVSLRDGRLENTREKRMWFEWKFGELPIVESNTFLKSTWTLLRSLRENLLSSSLTYFHGMPSLWLTIIEYIWFSLFPAIFVIHPCLVKYLLHYLLSLLLYFFSFFSFLLIMQVSSAIFVIYFAFSKVSVSHAHFPECILFPHSKLPLFQTTFLRFFNFNLFCNSQLLLQRFWPDTDLEGGVWNESDLKFTSYVKR